MQITVKGKNLEVPSDIRDEAVAKFSRVLKLFDRFIDMEIVFSEESNPRIADKIHCEVVLHAKGKYLRASASAPDLHRARRRTTAMARRDAATIPAMRHWMPRALVLAFCVAPPAQAIAQGQFQAVPLPVGTVADAG